MPHLECWSTRNNDNGFLPPELQYLYLVGTVTDHDKKEDGKDVVTSYVVKIDKETREVTTKSGSVYTLGEPNPKWLLWLEANGYDCSKDIFPYFTYTIPRHRFSSQE